MKYYFIFIVILAMASRISAIPPNLIGVWAECFPDSSNFIIYDSSGKFIDKQGIIHCLSQKIRRKQNAGIADIDECKKTILLIANETDTAYQYRYEADNIYIRINGLFLEMLTSPVKAEIKPQMKRYMRESSGEAVIENLINLLRREEKPPGGLNE
jgi:hypothetical protein